MLFMLAVTVWAMALTLRQFLAVGDVLLSVLSVLIFLLTAWLLLVAGASLRRQRLRELAEEGA